MTSIRAALDERSMTAAQLGIVAICVLLNMLDGYDVLAMAFTASGVTAEWSLSGTQLGFLLSAGLFGMAGGSLFVAPCADYFSPARCDFVLLGPHHRRHAIRWHVA
jgi:MFS family permease